MPAALVNKPAVAPKGKSTPPGRRAAIIIMMNEEIQEQINQLRITAQTMGDRALAAMSRGDAGLARTAARQAAQYARVVIQLETGEKQVEGEEAGLGGGSAMASTGESISV